LQKFFQTEILQELSIDGPFCDLVLKLICEYSFPWSEFYLNQLETITKWAHNINYQSLYHLFPSYLITLFHQVESPIKDSPNFFFYKLKTKLQNLNQITSNSPVLWTRPHLQNEVRKLKMFKKVYKHLNYCYHFPNKKRAVVILTRVRVFNATFNNISVISWRSVLLVEVPEKTTYHLLQAIDKLYHIM
jgi:hypothetical protein